MMRCLLRFCYGSVVVGLLMLHGIGGAAAHAVLEAATPPDRSIQAAAPTSFHLQFDEPVGVTDLRLLDAHGAVQPIRIEAKDAVISGDIQTALAPGTYVIAYRVISADGHPVAGAVQFQVGGGPEHWQAAATGLAWWQGGKIACQLLLYLGGFLFWAALYRARRRHVRPGLFAVMSSLTVIIAAPLLVAFQGAGMTGEGIGQLFTPSAWSTAGGTAEGRTALLFVVAIAGGWLAVLPRIHQHLAAALIWASAIAMISGLATVGHVAVLGWPQMTVLAIHVAAALLWTGSLVPLWRRLRNPLHLPATTPPRRRSSMAVIAVSVISGIGLACWQIVTPVSLLTGAYGLVLSAKVVAVMGVIGSLIMNRRLVQTDAATGQVRHKPWLVLQLCLIIVILGLTAALGQLTPPRHLLLAAGNASTGEQSQASQPVAQAMVHAGDVMAMLTLRSDESGHYALFVSFATMKGEMLKPQQVGLAMTNLDARIGPLARQVAGDDASGGFVVQSLDLIPAGRWRFEVTADVSDFDRRIFVLEALVPPGRP